MIDYKWTPRFAMSVVACLSAWGLPAGAKTLALPVNDTGMSKCLVNGKFTTNCQGTGQDGEFGRDVTHNKRKDGAAGFSYTKVCHSGEWAGTGDCPVNPVLGSGANDWGCTRDNVTGLTWELKTTDAGWRDWNRVYTNFGDHRAGDASEFVVQVNKQGLCGAKDWVLPTGQQLQSLIHHGTSMPAVDIAWLPNTGGGISGSSSGLYWTGEPVNGDSGSSYYVYFYNGLVSYNWQSDLNLVRLVRAAPAPAGKRFVISASGEEVIDKATGLIWRRCVEGLHWNGQRCQGTYLQLDWADALARASEQASQTGLAWRLPNVNELASLIDRGRWAPALDTKVFPDNPSDWVRSATPYVADRSYAWSVHFDTGMVGFDGHFDTTADAVRLVRNGQ